MAPRRTYRSVKVNNCSVYNNLSLRDVLCPICRSILVEPVTLPCTHGYCFSCFEGTIANASLTCPLCRIRFSSWHRVAKKENKIVNVDLWKAIKTSFPQQLENKLNGREEDLIEDAPRRLATPGQIRREYETQKSKEELELKKQRAAETRASEELIRKIKEQEEFDATVREEKLLLDEQVARQLAKEINFKPETNVSNKKCRPLDKFVHTVRNQNLNVSLQPIDAQPKKTFVTKILCQDKKSAQCLKTVRNSANDLKHGSLRKVSEVSDSNDSIENECHYFKPIDLKNVPPPKSVTVVKVPAKTHSACTVIIGPPTGKISFAHNYLTSAFARFEVFSPILGTPRNQKPTVLSPLTKRSPNKKRKLTDDTSDVSDSITETPIREAKRLNCVKNLKSPQKHSIFSLTRRPGIRKSNRISSTEKTPEKHYNAKCNLDNSPNTRSKQKILNQIYSNDFNLVSNATPSSPPFYGFDLGRKRTQGSYGSSNSATNSSSTDDTLNRRKLQEESDHALAKKLQEELNSVRYSTRSSIIHSNSKSCKKRRQVTLDEIIMSRSRVK